MSYIRIESDSSASYDDVMECLLENGFAVCERSQVLCREDTMVSVYTTSDRRHAEMWSEDEADSQSHICVHCEERYSENCGSYLDCTDGWVCDECASENYSICDGCGDTVASDNLDEDCHCPNCRQQDGLASYHSDKVRNKWQHIPVDAIGVELEFYAPDCGVRDESASEFRELDCAVERDGSLCASRGMEIITPPQSPNMVRETIRRICAIARGHSIIGQPRGDKNYGIHINLDCRNDNSETIAKFCNLFSSANQSWLEIVAGRKECDWAKYKRDVDNHIPQAKYAAAGQKGSRIEVRIFRSTNFVDSVLGFVSLCDDLRRYARSSDYDEYGFYSDRILAWLGEYGADDTVAMLDRKLRARNADNSYLRFLTLGIARKIAKS